MEQAVTANPYASDTKMLTVVMKLFEIRLLWYVAVMIYEVGKHLQNKYFKFIELKDVSDRISFDIRMATGEECRSDISDILSSGTHATLSDLKLLRKELSYDGLSMSVLQQHRFELFHNLQLQVAATRAWGVRHWQLPPPLVSLTIHFLFLVICV